MDQHTDPPDKQLWSVQRFPVLYKFVIPLNNQLKQKKRILIKYMNSDFHPQFFLSSNLWENTLKGDWTFNKNTHEKYYKVSLACRLRPGTLMYEGEFDTLPNYSQCYIMCVEIVSDSDHIAIIHWGPHCIIFYEIYAICSSPCSHLLPNLSHLLHAPQWLLMC